MAFCSKKLLNTFLGIFSSNDFRYKYSERYSWLLLRMLSENVWEIWYFTRNGWNHGRSQLTARLWFCRNRDIQQISLVLYFRSWITCYAGFSFLSLIVSILYVFKTEAGWGCLLLQSGANCSDAVRQWKKYHQTVPQNRRCCQIPSPSCSIWMFFEKYHCWRESHWCIIFSFYNLGSLFSLLLNTHSTCKLVKSRILLF